jgi:HTH-type transcriptional regulator/antitoxin HipB
LLIRDRRRSLSLSQAELAGRIGASRHWVMGVEAGKPTVELGLVLDTLSALELVCNLRPLEIFTGARGLDARPGASPDASDASDASDAPDASGSSTPRPMSSDLSRVLSRTRASGREPRDPMSGSRRSKT